MENVKNVTKNLIEICNCIQMVLDEDTTIEDIKNYVWEKEINNRKEVERFLLNEIRKILEKRMNTPVNYLLSPEKRYLSKPPYPYHLKSRFIYETCKPTKITEVEFGFKTKKDFIIGCKKILVNELKKLN